MPMMLRALLVAALGGALLPASGEVITFNKRPLPGPMSLQGIAAFTIYADQDAGAGKPFVEYRSVQAHSTDPATPDSGLASHTGLQLAVVEEQDFKEHIATGPNCTEKDELASSQMKLHLHNVHFTKTEFMHVDIEKTGTYFLIMVNCANFSQGVINGEVAVKNPFGYASATDYHKMKSYGWTLVGFAIMMAIWAVLCLMWKSELITMHGILSIVIGLGLVESAGWYLYLTNQNASGAASDSTQCTLVMLTVLMHYTALTFVLVISQGWRMTEEDLSECTLFKMALCGMLWVIANFVREGAMAHRQSLHIDPNFMLATFVPAMLVNVIAFAWIFHSLSRLTKGLKERNLDDQLRAVSRFTLALIVSCVLGIFVTLIQVLDIGGSLQVSWRYQYIADGGISHVIFMYMVGVAMWVWLPSAGSSQLGYAAPEDQVENAVWKEDGGDDEDGTTGSKVVPETVGAAVDEDL